MKLLIARELLDGTPRKAMTPARRKRVIAAHDGHCAHDGCNSTARLEIDHDIPLALGGSEDDGNLIVLCYPHHKEKTRRDVWQIAKAKRQRKLIEPVEPSKHPISQRVNPWPLGRQKIPSRPFFRKPA